MEANSSLGSAVCRVCLCGESSIPYLGKHGGEPLISPCHCKGTMGLYHKSCLEHWLSTSKTTQCEICKFQYEYGIKKQTMRRYFRKRGWAQPGYRSPIADFLVILIVAPFIVFLSYYCIMTAVKAHIRNSEDRPSSPEGIAMVVMAFFIIGGSLMWFALTLIYHFAQFRLWQAKHKVLFIIDQLEQEPTQYYNSTAYNQTEGAGRPLIERKLHWFKRHFQRLFCCGRGNRDVNVSLLSMRDPVIGINPEMIEPPSSPRFVSPAANANSSILSTSQMSSSASPQSTTSALSRASPATVSLSTFRPTSAVVHRPLCSSSPLGGEGERPSSSRTTDAPIYDIPPEMNTIFSDVDLGSPIEESPHSSSESSPSSILSRLSPSLSYL